MAHTLTYTHPAFPKDEEFDVPGIGLLQNGKPRKITADEERAFVALNGESLRDRFKDDASYKLEGTSELSAEEKKGGEG